MRRIVLALACCALLLAAACGGDDEPAAGADASGAPDNLTGVILAVDSEGLQDVTSFTLKDGNSEFEIFIDENVDYGFDLGHLREHLRTGDPVHVPVHEIDGKLYAAAIEDAS
jgi:hypothetical protein